MNLASEHSAMEEEKAEKPPPKQGGWITFPFLSGSILGIGLALSGTTSNFLVYLVQKYNMGSIDAAQITNIISGTLSLAPVAGAIIADAFFGCYSVTVISSAIQLLSLVLFTLTVALKSLRPTPCTIPGTDPCQAASTGQLTLLYSAVALLAIASGGTRFNLVTMGAYQFDRPADQAVFINWSFILFYTTFIIGYTAIVYIQDNVSWVLGFAISLGASVVGLIFLLLGTKLYRRPAPQGSPFTSLARVIVATVRKWKLNTESHMIPMYFHGNNDLVPPSSSFSIFNRAALIIEGDTNEDGAKPKPWKLCTVQEVEDFKTVVRIFPLWTSCIFVNITRGCLLNLSVLQALTMVRSVGPHFSIPAGSITVPSLVSFVFFLIVLDRILFPIWHWLARHPPTPLQRIGLGLLINVISMMSSALVERRRAAVIRSHQAQNHPGWIVPMSALWLLLPLTFSGFGESLHFPGQVQLFYQEFPKALKNTSTGIIALIIGVGFYLSTAFLSIVRHATTWLPDDLNRSRLENVYWLITIVDAINFVYFLVCSKFYKYQNSDGIEKAVANEISAS